MDPLLLPPPATPVDSIEERSIESLERCVQILTNQTQLLTTIMQHQEQMNEPLKKQAVIQESIIQVQQGQIHGLQEANALLVATNNKLMQQNYALHAKLMAQAEQLQQQRTLKEEPALETKEGEEETRVRPLPLLQKLSLE